MHNTVLLAVCAAISLVLVAVFVLRRRASSRGRAFLQPPDAHWLLGCIPKIGEYTAKGLHIDDYIMATAKKIGPVFEIPLVLMNMVAITDPDMAREVLHGKNYPKSPTYDTLHPFIGKESIVLSEGATWFKQRRAFTPAFSFQFLKTLVPVFVSKAERFMDKLEQLAETKAVFSFHQLARRLTMDIICAVAMDRHYDFMGSEEMPLVGRLFTTLLYDSAYYAERPHIAWTRHLPLPAARRIWSMQRQLDALLLEVVQDTLSKQQAQSAAADAGSPRAAAAASSTNSILALALQTAQQADGQGLNTDEVISQLKTFLFAGHDTTASTLAFAVYELTQRPEVEARVVEEVRHVLGSEPGAGAGASASPGGGSFAVSIDPDKLGALRYTTAVVKEVLRLWPPGGTARMAPPGSTLMGYDLTGKVLYVPAMPLHREKAAWGPDADSFRPERWLEDEGGSGAGSAAKVHPYQYMPFSKGPRDCIGQQFAMLEVRAVLAMMYSRFTFEYAYPVPESQGYMIVSQPKHGVNVRVMRR